MEAAPSLLEFLGGALSTFTMSRFPWGCGANCHACWAIVMKCYGDPLLCFHDTCFFKCIIIVVLVATQLDTFAGSRVIVPAHQKAGIKPVSWVGLIVLKLIWCPIAGWGCRLTHTTLRDMCSNDHPILLPPSSVLKLDPILHKATRNQFSQSNSQGEGDARKDKGNFACVKTLLPS